MATHGRSLDTTASPGTVWRLWSDPPTWHEWNPNVRRVTLDGPFANGTTGRMETPAGQSHAIEFANIQPERSFELLTSAMPGSRFAFRCEISPRDAGSTISQSIAMTGPLAFLFEPMMGERIAATFEPLLKGLAQKAEASDSAPAS
jgi:uncharacterized protein YndB with AHSA1/START domain